MQSLSAVICNPMDFSPPGSAVHWDSPGKNTGVGCHPLLQGILSIQGSNPGILHCRQILYHLSHQGSPFQSQTCTKKGHSHCLGVCCQSDPLQLSETITSGKYAHQINEMHQKLQCLQPALVNRKGAILLHDNA